MVPIALTGGNGVLADKKMGKSVHRWLARNIELLGEPIKKKMLTHITTDGSKLLYNTLG